MDDNATGLIGRKVKRLRNKFAAVYFLNDPYT